MPELGAHVVRCGFAWRRICVAEDGLRPYSRCEGRGASSEGPHAALRFAMRLMGYVPMGRERVEDAWC